MTGTSETVDFGGPYLAAAVLSESVLRETNGLNSIIRIIDQVTFSVPKDHVPSPEEFFPYQVQLFISFRAGSFEGEANIQVRPFGDIGVVGPETSMPVLFRGQSVGPQTGTNLHVSLNLGLRGAGQYWIDILLDDNLITRVPLKVLVETLEDETPGSGPSIADEANLGDAVR